MIDLTTLRKHSSWSVPYVGPEAPRHTQGSGVLSYLFSCGRWLVQTSKKARILGHFPIKYTSTSSRLFRRTAVTLLFDEESIS